MSVRLGELWTVRCPDKTRLEARTPLEVGKIFELMRKKFPGQKFKMKYANLDCEAAAKEE